MISFIRTDSQNEDFQKLVAELNEALRIMDGDEHAFYAPLNKTDLIKHAIVAYENNLPVGCGALRKYADETVEVKRMFVPKSHRGKGIASKILYELETLAKELNYKKCILETGKRQVEALQLYRSRGYKTIENYGSYKNVANSICFEKLI